MYTTMTTCRIYSMYGCIYTTITAYRIYSIYKGIYITTTICSPWKDLIYISPLYYEVLE